MHVLPLLHSLLGMYMCIKVYITSRNILLYKVYSGYTYTHFIEKYATLTVDQASGFAQVFNLIQS